MDFRSEYKIQRFLLDAIINYAGKASYIFVDLLLARLYIQILGIEYYGLIGIYGIFLILLGAFDFGVLPTLTKELAGYKTGKYSTSSVITFLKKIEARFFLFGLLIPIILYLLSSPINNGWINFNLVPSKEFSIILLFMGISLYGRLVESIYRAALSGLQEILKLNVLTIIISVTKYVLIEYVLVTTNNKIENIFLTLSVVSFISVIAFRRITYFVIKSIPNGSAKEFLKLSNVYKYTAGMAVISIQSIFLGQIDKIVLSKILSIAEFGIYTIIISITSIVFIGIFPIVNIFGPKAHELRASSNHRKLRHYYHETTKIISAIVGSIGIIIIIYSFEIVYLWLENTEIAETTKNNIRLIVIGNVLNALCWLPFQLQNAYGWIRYGIISNSITITLMVPLLMYITPKYGIEGAAYVWILLNGFYFFIGIQIMHLKIYKKEKKKWYFDDILVPILGPTILSFFIFTYFPMSSTNSAINFGIIVMNLVLNFLVSLALLEVVKICKRKLV